MRMTSSIRWSHSLFGVAVTVFSLFLRSTAGAVVTTGACQRSLTGTLLDMEISDLSQIVPLTEDHRSDCTLACSIQVAEAIRRYFRSSSPEPGRDLLLQMTTDLKSLFPTILPHREKPGFNLLETAFFVRSFVRALAPDLRFPFFMSIFSGKPTQNELKEGATNLWFLGTKVKDTTSNHMVVAHKIYIENDHLKAVVYDPFLGKNSTYQFVFKPNDNSLVLKLDPAQSFGVAAPYRSLEVLSALSLSPRGLDPLTESESHYENVVRRLIFTYQVFREPYPLIISVGHPDSIGGRDKAVEIVKNIVDDYNWAFKITTKYENSVFFNPERLPEVVALFEIKEWLARIDQVAKENDIWNWLMHHNLLEGLTIEGVNLNAPLLRVVSK